MQGTLGCESGRQPRLLLQLYDDGSQAVQLFYMSTRIWLHDRNPQVIAKCAAEFLMPCGSLNIIHAALLLLLVHGPFCVV